MDHHDSLVRRLRSALSERLSERVPPSLRGGMLDPGRRAVGALAVVGLVAALVAAAYLLRSRPEPVAAPARQSLTVSQPSPAPAQQRGPSTPAVPPKSPKSPGVLVVDVDGKVHDPGVYTLPAGSRVIDAVTKAGGIDQGAKTASINLARQLVDGEKILVGVPRPPGLTGPGSPGPSGSPGPGGASGPGGTKIDLNRATAGQLEQLPGIGEVLAGRIVEYRAEHGGFESVSQLTDVSGIGEATLADIEDKVRV